MKINPVSVFQQQGIKPVNTGSPQQSCSSGTNVPPDDECVLDNSSDTLTSQNGSQHWGAKYTKEAYDTLKPLLDAFKQRS